MKSPEFSQDQKYEIWMNSLPSFVSQVHTFNFNFFYSLRASLQVLLIGQEKTFMQEFMFQLISRLFQQSDLFFSIAGTFFLCVSIQDIELDNPAPFVRILIDLLDTHQPIIFEILFILDPMRCPLSLINNEFFITFVDSFMQTQITFDEDCVYFLSQFFSVSNRVYFI